MDEFSRLIVNDDKKALALAKTCITTPTLINTDIRQGIKYAVPLMCETIQMSASAEVSESLIISLEAKKQISDNVAPGSREWRLSGYIVGMDAVFNGGAQEYLSNRYQPLTKLHTDILWSWFNHGAVLVFKDGNARIFKQVAIKDLQTSQQKDSANATPFSLTLKEINVLPMGIADLTKADTFTDLRKLAISKPTAGTATGQASPMGTVTAVIASAANVGAF